jgi:hypothetical protein
MREPDMTGQRKTMNVLLVENHPGRRICIAMCNFSPPPLNFAP